MSNGPPVLSVHPLRRLAERLLGSIVITRRLPASHGGGRIVVNARTGGLKYLFKPADSIDAELLRIAKLLVNRGDSVWDVGANVGLFSMAASHHAGTVGRVLAIEADQDAVSLLFRTARHCTGSPLTILPIAANEEDGFVRFSIARRARAANAIEGLGSTQTGGVLEVRILPASRLDSLVPHFGVPQVLKVDVEGAELGVLRGATSILLGAKPRIYCEVTASTRDEVCRLLQSFDYSLYDGESYVANTFRAVTERTSNLVAIPKRASCREDADVQRDAITTKVV